MHLDLSGSWTLKSAPGENLREWLSPEASERLAVEGIRFLAPGDTVSALVAAGLIEDPYYGRNELKAQWVGKVDWLLEYSFLGSQEQAASRDVLLHFDSLDTVVSVELNGVVVGHSDTMFVPFESRVTGLIKTGNNIIRLHILSPERMALLRAQTLAYPVPCTGAPVTSPHRNLLRKVQCHAGWDWGPCLMVSGWYGKGWLNLGDECRVEALELRTEAVGKDWHVRVHLALSARSEEDIVCMASLEGEDLPFTVAIHNGHGLADFDLVLKDPELWWPAGYGTQRLYELSIQTGSLVTKRRIGFRTLEWVRQPDERGSSFYCRVNGVDVYARGTNWIPCDALPARISDERVRNLLLDARAANMNMVRVWGGGAYESDFFYECCDELGLLVWQDFMFACSLYPADPSFLASVRAEVGAQTRRLMHHPSLALWCGNNENLGALKWYPESREKRDRYLVDYDRLNEGVVGQTVEAIDSGRLFWPTSPCAGRGDYDDTWHVDGKGDMHYWSVWHEGKPFEAYRDIVPRFVSEFGYQSFPSLETIALYAREEDLNVCSPVMEHHQKNMRGNTIILENMARYFRFPHSFEAMIYVSQVQQAMAIQTALEYWRTLRPVCMGALVWQLNDVWPVASWSSLEYTGAWKLLHYTQRRVFADLLLSPRIETGKGFSLWCSNESLHQHTDELEVQIWAFDGNLAAEYRVPVSIAAQSAHEIFVYQGERAWLDPERYFMHARLVASGTRAWSFFAEPKRADLHKAQLKKEILPGKTANEFVVRLTSNKPLFWLSLEARGVDAWFSDNGFVLLPGETREVLVSPRRTKGKFAGLKLETLTLENLERALVVRHLL